MSQALPNDGPLVLYDGECGLCDRAVQFLVRLDRGGRLRFAPLQGETARGILGKVELGTMVLIDEAGQHVRSTAALRAMRHAGGIGRLLAVGLWVPRPLRDVIYSWIARNRIRWFGTVDRCQIPSPELAKRLLP